MAHTARGAVVRVRGAAVGVRGAAVGNIGIPTYVISRGAVVRQPSSCLNNESAKHVTVVSSITSRLFHF